MFTIPFPPSVNNLFVNAGRRRFPSPRYKAWREEAALKLNAQHVPTLKGPVRVEFSFGRPDKRKRDLDNLLKASLDLLVSQGVIEDDSQVVGISADWLSKPGEVICNIKEVSP